MISKKVKQAIVCTMMLGLIVGASPMTVFADSTSGESNKEVVQSINNDVLQNGKYEIKNNTSYVTPGNATGESMARRALNETTKFEVKDGKYITELSFTDSLFSFMQNIKISVDGKEIESTLNKDTKTVTFSVDSIYDEIRVDMYISIMGRDVSLFVKNDKSTLNVINEAPIISGQDISVKVGEELDLMKLVSVSDRENEDIDLQITSDISNFIDNGKIIKAGKHEVTYKAIDASGFYSTKTICIDAAEKEKKVIEEGIYTIKNKTEYIGSGNSQVGNDMARKTLKDSTYLEVKGEKNILNLRFDEEQFKFIGDVKVQVDGKNTDIVLDRSKAEATFQIPSIESEIIVTVEVKIMGRETSFKTVLLEETLEKVKKEEVDKQDPNKEDSNKENNDNKEENNGDENTDKDKEINTPGSTVDPSSNKETGSSNNDSEKVSVKNEIVKGKLYSIENEVHYKDNNPTGMAMARQYLDSTSTIEEVNGVKYINLTFSGIDYMSNHRFYVNGKEVSFRKTSDDGKKATFRFEIPDLSSTIKVKMFVAPMGRDVEFDVTLKEDTLKFIKEYSAEVLPQTGSLVNSNLLLMIGSALTASGVMLKKRK